MNHVINITPLNCSYDVGQNAFIKAELSEYNAVADRGIYFKDPDVSWFRMKAISATPYLEPALFGIRAGDTIKVKFDALVISGNVNDFQVTFRKINSNGTVAGTSYVQEIPDGSLKSHFKHFNIPFVIMPDISDGDGILLNLRHFSNNTEMIIKNIEIEIDTSNNKFSVDDNVVVYKNNRDFLKCINLYSGTDLNLAYRGLRTIFSEGGVTFPDVNTISMSSTNKTIFKGLFAFMSASKYYQPQSIYLEYRIKNTNNLIVAARDVDNSGLSINEEQRLTAVVSNGSWRKAIYYFKGRPNDKRGVFLNFGLTGFDIDIDIRNVRFSLPRFDDEVKIKSNDLEELYTDLGSLLRT